MGWDRPRRWFLSAALGACLLAVALPPSRDGRVDPSLDSVRRLIRERKHAEAKDLATRLLASVQGRPGQKTLEASVIEALIEAWVMTGCVDGSQALPLAERAVEIRSKEAATTPREMALALAAQADVLAEIGERERAVGIRRRVLDLLKEDPAGDELDRAMALYKLGRDLAAEARQAEATETLQRAVEIRERSLGPRSPLVAETLEALALSLPYGDPKARGHAERAVAIQEGAPESERTDLAGALSTLGLMRNREGDSIGARRLHERALVLYEAQFGLDDVHTGRVLLNLALTFQDRGENAEARRILERLLPIRVSCLGPSHPKTSVILNNLGIIYTETGNYAMARGVFERALAIRRSMLREGHPWIAHTLNNLAQALFEQGDLDGARRAVEESLVIREKQGGKREIAQAEANLAEVLVAAHDYTAAKEHLERALGLQVSVWGPEHRDVALTEIGLGWLSLETGEYGKAVEVLSRAVLMLRKTMGPSAPQLPVAVARIARAQRFAGKPAAALESAIEAETIAREQFRATTRTFSEKEALRYASVRVSGLDVALRLLEESPSKVPPDAGDRVFDQLVRSRALVLDEMATRRPSYLSEGPPDLEALAERLQNARTRLAKLALDPNGSDEEAERARVAAEEAERKLAERSKAERQRIFRFQLGSEEIRAGLPQNASLVAYARYRVPSPARSRAPSSDAYLAFVLRHRDSRPVLVSLGPAERIDGMVERWHARVAAAPPPLPAAAREAEARYLEAGDELRRAVWEPVAAAIGKPEILFIVPDGALHQVSFGALPGAGGRYLVEEGPRIHYLSAERDLAASSVSKSRGRGLLAVGDPDVDLPPDLPAPRGGSSLAEELVRPVHNRKSECEDLRSRIFSRLPGAREETKEIVSLWRTSAGGTAGKGDVVLLTGASAGEAEFKSRAPGRRFIHLATHGFFGPETCGSALRPADSSPGEARGGGATLRESPLLHSGLALAGANQRERLPPDSAQEDGILTAEEIASLDLSATEWVVLSGCETGVGRVQNGEGVLGLRRAFEVAGASTLIMSLWEVKDEAAREWMQALYRARLGGVSTADAVRSAHLSTLEARRRQGRSTHPYYWGPFVAVGDWR